MRREKNASFERGRDPCLKFAFRSRCIDFIAYTHGAFFFINSLSLSFSFSSSAEIERVDGRSKIIGQYFVIISFTMSRDFSFTRRKLLWYTNSKNNSLPYWSLYDPTLSSLIIVVNVSHHVLILFIEHDKTHCCPLYFAPSLRKFDLWTSRLSKLLLAWFLVV